MSCAWRWPGLWRRLGAGAIPDVQPLLARWAGAQRRYHGLAHLRARMN